MLKLGLPLLAILLGILLGASGGAVAGFALSQSSAAIEMRGEPPPKAPKPAANSLSDANAPSAAYPAVASEARRPANPSADRGPVYMPSRRSDVDSGPQPNPLSPATASTPKLVQWSREISSTLLVGFCGDQNSDDNVSLVDVVIGLQIVVRLIQPTLAQSFFGDLDGDGEITVGDAIMGLKHIVGLIPALNECGPKFAE